MRIPAPHLLVSLLGVLTTTATGAPEKEDRIAFDKDVPGATPSGWSTGVTGHGDPEWRVVADDSAPIDPNVLEQSGEAKFTWAVVDDSHAKDGFVEVKFKPVDGVQDQAGGVIWRFADEGNYYVCRANALEDNVVLYKTEEGNRSSLQVKGRLFGYGVDAKVRSGTWSTLRVDFEGNLFTVRFNGKELLQVEDDTFAGAGKVGLWTKADSLTQFDDFRYATKKP